MQDEFDAQSHVAPSPIPTDAVATPTIEVLLSEGKPVTASVQGNLGLPDVVTSEQVTNRASFHFSSPLLPCAGFQVCQNLRSRRPSAAVFA